MPTHKSYVNKEEANTILCDFSYLIITILQNLKNIFQK